MTRGCAYRLAAGLLCSMGSLNIGSDPNVGQTDEYSTSAPMVPDRIPVAPGLADDGPVALCSNRRWQRQTAVQYLQPICSVGAVTFELTPHRDGNREEGPSVTFAPASVRVVSGHAFQFGHGAFGAIVPRHGGREPPGIVSKSRIGQDPLDCMSNQLRGRYRAQAHPRATGCYSRGVVRLVADQRYAHHRYGRVQCLDDTPIPQCVISAAAYGSTAEWGRTAR
jgi:hypothetical protein